MLIFTVFLPISLIQKEFLSPAFGKKCNAEAVPDKPMHLMSPANWLSPEASPNFFPPAYENGDAAPSAPRQRRSY